MFIQLMGLRNPAEVDLWPSQRKAAKRAVDVADDLIVALPTSAGKTRIAELCILRTFSTGKRVVYVTPLRALSGQLERTLGRIFRPLGYSVSSLYGASGVAVADVGTLASTDLVAATPEKLDFAIRQDPSVLDDVGLIVLDEGHMIGLGTREIRYEVLVQRLLRRSDAEDRRLVCLSAVFSPGESFDDFTQWLRNDAEGEPIHSAWKPTRHRPGTVLWQSTGGRLELEADDERPWVPSFV
jgi:replicative superfamily II helicase